MESCWFWRTPISLALLKMWIPRWGWSIHWTRSPGWPPTGWGEEIWEESVLTLSTIPPQKDWSRHGGSFGCTILDAMSTMLLMGMDAEYVALPHLQPYPWHVSRGTFAHPFLCLCHSSRPLLHLSPSFVPIPGTCRFFASPDRRMSPGERVPYALQEAWGVLAQHSTRLTGCFYGFWS